MRLAVEVQALWTTHFPKAEAVGEMAGARGQGMGSERARVEVMAARTKQPRCRAHRPPPHKDGGTWAAIQADSAQQLGAGWVGAPVAMAFRSCVALPCRE